MCSDAQTGCRPSASATHSRRPTRCTGERYARDGFIVNYGLPASLYGKRFTDEGTLGRLKAQRGREFTGPENAVYTGYPPGPDWLCGIYTKLFGVERVGLFRIFPVALNILACVAFLVVLERVFGRWRASGSISPAC